MASLRSYDSTGDLAVFDVDPLAAAHRAVGADGSYDLVGFGGAGFELDWRRNLAVPPGASLSLLRSWRTTDQAGIGSRMPRVVPPSPDGGRAAVVRPSPQPILVNDVIQKVAAARAGKP